jgi:hypothetical protein
LRLFKEKKLKSENANAVLPLSSDTEEMALEDQNINEKKSSNEEKHVNK